LLLLGCCTLTTDSQAQQTGKTNHGYVDAPPGTRDKPDPKQWMNVPLQRAPSLPQLPEYSGRTPKFDSGHYYPNLHHGECFMVNYLLLEKPEQVSDWYYAALSGAGWVIDPRKSTPKYIMARIQTKGLYCMVSINPTYVGKYKTALDIRYMNNGTPVGPSS
jgi:hypothetical protein